MSCIQATSVFKPGVILPGRAQLQHIPVFAKGHHTGAGILFWKHIVQIPWPRCVNSKDGKSPWDAFGKAVGNFGEGQSIEDVLRQQMEKKEYYDGSGGKSPPCGGGSGGGDGFGEPEHKGLAGFVDETIQVMLATIGIIFFYIYIISGEEMLRLAKDFIKYLFGGGQSVRLKNAMYVTGSLFKRVQRQKLVHPESWLDVAIATTPTWYERPENYSQPFISSMESQEDQDESRIL